MKLVHSEVNRTRGMTLGRCYNAAVAPHHLQRTKSSSVTERPQRFLCNLLLVIATSDLPMRTIKFCSVVFSITLRLLVINTSLPIYCEQQTMPLTSDECHQLATVRRSYVCNTWRCSRSIHNTQWSQILGENRNFSLPILHSMPSLVGFPSKYCHNVPYRKTTTFFFFSYACHLP